MEEGLLSECVGVFREDLLVSLHSLCRMHAMKGRR